METPYTKPKQPEQLLADYQTVLLATKDKTDIVSFYAFHGVKSEISLSIGFLKRKLPHASKGEGVRIAGYLSILERLNCINWPY